MEVIDRQTVRALSADTRQDMLKLLSKRPHTASEMARTLDRHVTTITEHLSVLEHSGVIRKKESTNKWVYYTLTDKGEKLFKPNFAWAFMFSITLVLLVGGLYQVFYVQYQASIYTIDQQAAMKTAEGLEMATETTAAFDTNLYVGVGALLLSIVLGYQAWLLRRKHDFARAETLRAISEK